MLNYAVAVSLISLGLQQTGPDTPPDPLLTPIKYRNLQENLVGDAGFEPATPSLLGQTFPGEFCPVGKSRIYKRFLPFLAPSFSCSVRMRPAPVAAWLQHLTFPRPAPFPHTLSGPGNPLVIESCAERWAEQASPTPKYKIRSP